MKKRIQRRRVRRTKRHDAPPTRASGNAKQWGWGALALVLCALGLVIVLWPRPAVKPTIPAANREAVPEPAADQALPRAGDDQQMHRILDAFDHRAETIVQIQEEERVLAEHVLQAFSHSDQAHALMGTVLRQQGRSTEAVPHLEKALEMNPRRFDLYQDLGDIAKAKGDLDRAIEIWRRGLALIPDAPGLRWLIADALMSQGEYTEAPDLLKRECQITPKAARNYYLLGQMFSHFGQSDRARTSYERAIAINPEFYNAYYGLGTLCAKLKQTDQARDYLARFKALRSQAQTSIDQRDQIGDVVRARARAASYYWTVQKMYQRQGRSAVAEKLIARAMLLDPGHASYAEGLAVLRYRQGRPTEALSLYERAREADPNSLIYCLNIGKLNAELGRLVEAETSYREAIRRFPRAGAAYGGLARLFLQSRRHLDQTVALAQQAVTLSATAEHYFLLAWAYSLSNDLKRGLSAVERALQMEPQNTRYRDLYERIQRSLASPSSRDPNAAP